MRSVVTVLDEKRCRWFVLKLRSDLPSRYALKIQSASIQNLLSIFRPQNWSHADSSGWSRTQTIAVESTYGFCKKCSCCPIVWNSKKSSIWFVVLYRLVSFTLWSKRYFRCTTFFINLRIALWRLPKKQLVFQSCRITIMGPYNCRANHESKRSIPSKWFKGASQYAAYLPNFSWVSQRIPTTFVSTVQCIWDHWLQWGMSCLSIDWQINTVYSSCALLRIIVIEFGISKN